MDKSITEKEIEVKDMSFFYGEKEALKNVTLNVEKNKITSLIGPSGCGKTTLLRCFNRMHDLYKGNRYTGEIIFKNQNILDKNIDITKLRTDIGMVFQKPTPFPMSIFDNVAYGLRLKGIKNKTELHNRVEHVLKKSALWNEVADRLSSSAMGLSGGQQQRLCLARTLAPEPDVVLFDEPTSALDPISTKKIEELRKVDEDTANKVTQALKSNGATPLQLNEKGAKFLQQGQKQGTNVDSFKGKKKPDKEAAKKVLEQEGWFMSTMKEIFSKETLISLIPFSQKPTLADFGQFFLCMKDYVAR